MADPESRLSLKRRVAAVGTFDGLHKGHRRVISKVKEEAASRGLEPLVVMFDRHPLETLAPERAPGLLQSPSERTNILYNEGLGIMVLEFTPTLAAMTAEDWLRKMHDDQGVDVLIVGYDNTFGSDGTRMNLSDYRNLGAKIGVEVLEAPYEPHTSSSAIRRLVADGDVVGAANLLGYKFAITGEVVAGKHIGSSIGTPTANVRPSYRAQMPKNGVYVVDVLTPDGRKHRGVANIGYQPTVASDAPLRLEVHIPDFRGDLYGEKLRVEFLGRLRDEMKFDSLESLKERISLDILAALNFTGKTESDGQTSASGTNKNKTL